MIPNLASRVRNLALRSARAAGGRERIAAGVHGRPSALGASWRVEMAALSDRSICQVGLAAVIPKTCAGTANLSILDEESLDAQVLP